MYLSAMLPPQAQLTLPTESEPVRVKVWPWILLLTEPVPLKRAVITLLATPTERTYLPLMEVSADKPAAALLAGHAPRSA